jgi:hypothetical protein
MKTEAEIRQMRDELRRAIESAWAVYNTWTTSGFTEVKSPPPPNVAWFQGQDAALAWVLGGAES